MNHMSINERLAYLAGILDGEGSLYISKSKDKRYTAGIKISMNDKESLELFQKTFGGNIIRGTKKIDKVTGKHYAPAWVLQYRGQNDILNIIKSLYPFLQIKQPQAEILWQFIALKPNWYLTKFQLHGLYNNLYIKSRKIKKQNWQKVTQPQK